MAKKFGKFLLATAAIGTAVAAAYYYFQKKDADLSATINDDEDFDDLDDTDSSRNYVPLNCETVQSAEEDAATTEDSFTPLAEQISQAEETVEDFFDEEDSSEN